MGLDTTIYRASPQRDGFANPYAPDPPEGLHWNELVMWRKNHVLTEALFPGAGSPDWKTLTVADLDKALAATASEVRDIPSSEVLDFRTRARLQVALRDTATVLREIREGIKNGETYIVEVVR